jgi:hypothetical protein
MGRRNFDDRTRGRQELGLEQREAWPGSVAVHVWRWEEAKGCPFAMLAMLASGTSAWDMSLARDVIGQPGSFIAL